MTVTLRDLDVHVNWYGNIVAAGRCVVVHHRRQYPVIRIEPCSVDYGRSAFPAPARLILRVARCAS